MATTTKRMKPDPTTSGAPTFEVSIGDETSTPAPIRVRLVGVEYEVIPPKSAIAFGLAQRARSGDGSGVAYLDIIEGLNEWMKGAFGDRAAEVEARLLDPNDRLDTNHIFELFRAVIARGSSVPTS